MQRVCEVCPWVDPCVCVCVCAVGGEGERMEYLTYDVRARAGGVALDLEF